MMRDTDDNGVNSFPLTPCQPSFLFLFPKLSAKGWQLALHTTYWRAGKEASKEIKGI